MPIDLKLSFFQYLKHFMVYMVLHCILSMSHMLTVHEPEQCVSVRLKPLERQLSAFTLFV